MSSPRAAHVAICSDDDLEPRARASGDIALKKARVDYEGCPVAVIDGADWTADYYDEVFCDGQRPLVSVHDVRDLATGLAEQHKVTISRDLLPYL